MAVNDPMVQGLAETMASVNTLAPTSFYSVWNGATIVFSYNKEDSEEGISYLEENLRALHDNKNRSLYTIKWHPELSPGFITAKTPVIASLSFRITPHDSSSYKLDGDNFKARFEANAELKDEIKLMRSEISALMSQEPETDPTERSIGMVKSLMQDPVIGAVVARIVDAIMPVKQIPMQYPQQAAIGNIPLPSTDQQPKALTQADIDKINAALEILCLSDPDLANNLTRLAAISQNDKSTFNMLLKMLKQM